MHTCTFDHDCITHAYICMGVLVGVGQLSNSKVARMHRDCFSDRCVHVAHLALTSARVTFPCFADPGAPFSAGRTALSRAPGERARRALFAASWSARSRSRPRPLGPALAIGLAGEAVCGPSQTSHFAASAPQLQLARNVNQRRKY